MLGEYLNQQVTYAPLASLDNRGQPIYGESTVVPCRRRNTFREILTADMQRIRAEHLYYLGQKVQIGDSLDGKRVQLVTEWVTLGGEVIGYKAVV